MNSSLLSDAPAQRLRPWLFDAFDAPRIMWADTGYNGKPLEKYARLVAVTVEVVARISPHSFQVLRR
jgi:hypothetical protein